MKIKIIERIKGWEPKKKKLVFGIIGGILALAIVLTAVMVPLHFATLTYSDPAEGFTLPIVTLEEIGGERVTVDKPGYYLAHPDLVLTKSGKLITMYPSGHGKGAIITKTSDDYGRSWSARLTDTPASWESSQETPTIYRLTFVDEQGEQNGEEVIVMTSGCPSWPGTLYKIDGFQCSLSADDGESWSEFQKFYGRDWAKANGKEAFDCIVSMSSLTQLKENGKFVNRWMGTFHDHDFYNYKTILSFKTDGNGNLLRDESGRPIAEWSEPERLIEQWRGYEKSDNICEVEIIRTPGEDGKTLSGDTLIMIARLNKHERNSFIFFSDDEGGSWTEPVSLPAELTGDRHKAEYDPTTGKLVIGFRHVVMGKCWSAVSLPRAEAVSLGWIGWVGTFEDLLSYRGDSSGYRKGEKVIVFSSNYNGGADCGYSGTVCVDGTFTMISYGYFDADTKVPYIMSVRFSLNEEK